MLENGCLVHEALFWCIVEKAFRLSEKRQLTFLGLKRVEGIPSGVIHVLGEIILVPVFITVKLLVEIIEGLDVAGLHIDVSLDLLLAIVGLIPRLFAPAEVK